MPIGFHHDFEDLKSKRLGNVMMEHVGHRIDEHYPWLTPPQRLIKPLRPKANCERIETVVRGID